MKRNRILLCLIAAAAVMSNYGTPLMAQCGDPFNFVAVTTPSVGAWAMDRRSMSQPSLYTGAMNWSMQLVQYSDPDFDIPVTLCYSFDGYRPCIHSGVVGLGWSIDCGGIITREIRGFADESLMSDTGVAGYWFTSRSANVCRRQLLSSSASHPMSPDSEEDPLSRSLFSESPCHTDHYVCVDDHNDLVTNRYDPSPDIFHYSMLGHHGDFVLTDGGEIVVFNSDQPHGEVSVTMDVSNTGIPSFTISTGDGYVYRFGGDAKSYEWSSSFSTEISEEIDMESYGKSISGIRLVEIIAPNGRRARFEYTGGWMHEGTAGVYYTRKLMASGAAGSHGEYYQELMCASHKAVNLIYSYHCPLTQVRVDGHRCLKFCYETRTLPEFARGSFINTSAGSMAENLDIRDLVDTGVSEQRLSSVSLIDRHGDEVSKASMSYFQTSPSGTPKMFLRSVSTTSGGLTSFSYNATESMQFPYQDTQAVDHWGYWNGRQVTDLRESSFINVAMCNSLYDQFQSSHIKDADPYYSARGALTRIVYPGGGYEEISYEGNRVSRRIDQRRMGYPGLVTLAEDYIVGGVRVNQVTRYDTDGELLDSRHWYYQSENSDLSSGILTQMPRYGLALDYTFTTSSYYYHVQTGMYTRESLPSLTRGHHLGYSHVRETYPDGSFVTSDFADYVNYPDVYYGTDVDNGIWAMAIPYVNQENWYTQDPYSGDISLRNFLCTPASIDYGYMRGRLLHQESRDSRGRVTRVVENFYSSETVAEVPYAVNVMFAFAMYPYMCREAHLQDTWTTEYSADCPITVEVNNFYNSKGQLEVTTRIGGVAGKVTNRICYCHEMDSTLVSGLSCFPSSVYSTTSERTLNNSTSEVERVVYGYDMPSGNPQPTSFTLYKDGHSRSASALYDDNFRPVRIDYPGGCWTQYLWSADGRYLLGSTRNDSSNSTSYTWQDLVGLTSVTLPSGQSENYTYDSKGRLSERRNSDGEKTVSYEYKLVNEE